MYHHGQVVELWQEDMRPGDAHVVVLKRVLVTIQGIKTGVPGEFSGKPVSERSLWGIGDDGKLYEKHWRTWPESQMRDFVDQWSLRDDGEGEDPFWFPMEAVFAHNRLHRDNRKLAKQGRPPITRADTDGNTVRPRGDVRHCARHDEYFYQKSSIGCFPCYMETVTATEEDSQVASV